MTDHTYLYLDVVHYVYNKIYITNLIFKFREQILVLMLEEVPEAEMLFNNCRYDGPCLSNNN